jgi:hypothetical protein
MSAFETKLGVNGVMGTTTSMSMQEFILAPFQHLSNAFSKRI